MGEISTAQLRILGLIPRKSLKGLLRRSTWTGRQVGQLGEDLRVQDWRQEDR